MTLGISMLGGEPDCVSRTHDTNGYALASGRAGRIVRRVTSSENDLAPSMSSDLEAFSH